MYASGSKLGSVPTYLLKPAPLNTTVSVYRRGRYRSSVYQRGMVVLEEHVPSPKKKYIYKLVCAMATLKVDRYKTVINSTTTKNVCNKKMD